MDTGTWEKILVYLVGSGIVAIIAAILGSRIATVRLEERMTVSKDDRKDLWGAIEAIRKGCAEHMEERGEVRTDLSNLKIMVTEIRKDVKSLLRNGKKEVDGD